jgi:diacylglycerol kinase
MESMRYAHKGIRHAFWTQRNIRIHLFIGAAVFAAGFYLRLDRNEFAVLIITIGFVIMAEMVNTAIEEAVDLASPGRHEKATVAKDVAAGAVLFSAVCAIIVGCLIFIPHLAGLGR